MPVIASITVAATYLAVCSKRKTMTEQQALERRLEDLKVRFRREVIQGHPTQRLIDTIAELHSLLGKRRPTGLSKDEPAP